MNYLVKIRPLEPYAFGTDKTSAYVGAERTGEGTYLVRSKNVPEQTTLLGMLRYITLEAEGLLKTDYSYTPDERAKMKQCIGPDSFQFSAPKAGLWIDSSGITRIYTESAGKYLY